MSERQSSLVFCSLLLRLMLLGVILSRSLIVTGLEDAKKSCAGQRCIPIKLAYVKFEPAGGADKSLSPIIFMHGATMSKEYWCFIPQIIANKTKRLAYAIDARNHGDSGWSDDYNFDMNADDLFHFMDTISVSKAVLIGHSMGGITGIKAALRSPERVEMLFVEDMTVKKLSQETLSPEVSYLHLFQKVIRQVPADTPEEDVSREIMKLISANEPGVVDNLFNKDAICAIKFPLKRDNEGRYVSKNNMDALAKAYSNAETLMTEAKGLYEGPAYFVYGTISTVKVNEDEERIRKHFPKAELIRVENAGHLIHNQFPEKFTDIIVKNMLK